VTGEIVEERPELNVCVRAVNTYAAGAAG